MDYVEWLDDVMKALGRVWQRTPPGSRTLGVPLGDVMAELNLPHQGDGARSILHAPLVELRDLGLVNLESLSFISLTNEGRKFPGATLATAWHSIFDIFLEDGTEPILRALWELGHETDEHGYPRLREVYGSEIEKHLGRAWEDDAPGMEYHERFQYLDRLGLVRRRPTLGPPAATLRWAGAVRATRLQASAERRLLAELLAGGEVASVDFKRELKTARPAEKAEFVRDCLGLANAQLAGPRYLVIGFDEDGTFHPRPTPFPRVGDLEQILHSWTQPTPSLQLTVVPWDGGDAAVLEIQRDPKDLPYLGVKSESKLIAGATYTRHGRHTTPADPDEAEDIAAEGVRARGS